MPNSCSLESSASRVAQRSMDFFTIQRRDVSQRKPPLGAQKVQEMQCMHPSHGHMKQAYLLSVNTAESAWVCWCSNGCLEGYCPLGIASKEKLFNARVLQGESCTLFPTGTQTIRNRSSNAVAAGSSTSILESDLIHFLSCGAWILIPGDTAF